MRHGADFLTGEVGLPDSGTRCAEESTSGADRPDVTGVGGGEMAFD